MKFDIEPNFIGNSIYGPENDEHRQASPFEYKGFSNVEYGEQLPRGIFNALSASGFWSSTLLVILFDEHGGVADHVPPPAAVRPEDKVVTGPGGYGFLFDRYGVRVPAVVVSPWVTAGTISQTVYDHTSVLATVMDRFLGASRTISERALRKRPTPPV